MEAKPLIDGLRLAVGRVVPGPSGAGATTTRAHRPGSSPWSWPSAAERRRGLDMTVWPRRGPEHSSLSVLHGVLLGDDLNARPEKEAQTCAAAAADRPELPEHDAGERPAAVKHRGCLDADRHELVLHGVLLEPLVERSLALWRPVGCEHKL